jgi:hypothetical protein
MNAAALMKRPGLGTFSLAIFIHFAQGAGYGTGIPSAQTPALLNLPVPIHLARLRILFVVTVSVTQSLNTVLENGVDPCLQLLGRFLTLLLAG